MKFTCTSVCGAFLLEAERHEDERGFFARTWCRREFEAQGVESDFVQGSVSYTRLRGTVRGMHFQETPHQEIKLVRCTRGAVCDTIVDLRPESPTFRQHYSVVLSADRGNAVYVPKGVAHGLQTLADDTEVSYLMSEFYCAECARGVRWNDPAFDIQWPEPVTVIRDRDRSYPDFTW